MRKMNEGRTHPVYFQIYTRCKLACLHNNKLAVAPRAVTAAHIGCQIHNSALEVFRLADTTLHELSFSNSNLIAE